MMVDIISPLVCTAIKPGYATTPNISTVFLYQFDPHVRYATTFFARPLDLKVGTLKQVCVCMYACIHMCVCMCVLYVT